MSFIQTIAQRVMDVCRSAGETDFCATVEWRHNADYWFQINGWYVNCCYPFSDPPDELFTRLDISIPETIELSEWQPKLFVTLEHVCESGNDIDSFLTNYITKALQVKLDESDISIKEEWM